MAIQILFVCKNNATLSILAEALLNDMGKGAFEASSAGSSPTAVDPRAVAVLAENYIQASSFESKPLSRFEGRSFDYVIALTDDASDGELDPPEGRLGRFRWRFSDPALQPVDDKDRLVAFRHVVVDLRQRLSLFMIVTSREQRGAAAATRHLQPAA